MEQYFEDAELRADIDEETMRQEQEAPLQSVDCDWVTLCQSSVCNCEQDGCFLGTGEFGPHFALHAEGLLELRRVGEELVGLFTEGLFVNPRGLFTPLGTVRFRRVE